MASLAEQMAALEAQMAVLKSKMQDEAAKADVKEKVAVWEDAVSKKKAKVEVMVSTGGGR
jgi:hypothetical protein